MWLPRCWCWRSISSLMRGRRFGRGSLLVLRSRALAAAARLRGFCWFRSGSNVFDGALVLGPQTELIQIALLVMTILVVLLSIESTFTEHVSEYLALILFATASMMFLVSSQNILLIFISLELLSLSLYVLTAFKKRSARSAEAALKYFLFGGMSAAFVLFGLRLLYGLSELDQSGADRAVDQGAGRLDPLLVAAMVMVVIGFGFKVAAAPFHFWAPDVYEAAPAGSAALIASSSKVAGFVIFYRVMTLGFAGARGQRRVGRLCCRVGAGDRGAGWALDGAGQPGCDSADQRAAVAGLLGHCACGLHAAWAGGAYGAELRGAALLRADLWADDHRRVWRGGGG